MIREGLKQIAIYVTAVLLSFSGPSLGDAQETTAPTGAQVRAILSQAGAKLKEAKTPEAQKSVLAERNEKLADLLSRADRATETDLPALVDAAVNLGNDADVIRFAERAIAASTDDPTTHYNLMRSYLHVGRGDDAVRALSRAQLRFPNNQGLRSHLPELYRGFSIYVSARSRAATTNDSRRAITELQRTTLEGFYRQAVADGTKEYSVLADAATQLRRYDEAAEWKKKSAAAKPDDPQPQLALTQACLAAKQFDEAAGSLAAIEQRFGPQADGLRLRLMLVKGYLEVKRAESATAEFRKWRAQNGDEAPTSLPQKTLLSDVQGRAEALYAHYWAWKAQGVKTPEDDRNAIPPLRLALEIERLSKGAETAHLAELLGNLGYVLRRTGDAEGSAKAFAEAAPLYARFAPGTLKSREIHGAFEESSLWVKLSAAERDELTEASNKWFNAIRLVGGTHGTDQANLLREALDVQQRLLGECSTTLQTRKWYVIALHLVDRNEEAVEQGRKVIAEIERRYGKKDPEFLDALINLATALSSCERYAEAESLFRTGLDLAHSDNRDISYLEPLTVSYAKMIADLGDYPKAMKLLRDLCDQGRKAGRVGSGFATALNNLAAIYETLGDVEQARALYEEAMTHRRYTLPKLAHVFAMPMTNLADLYRAEGNMARAEELGREALQLVRDGVGTDTREYALCLHNLGHTLQSRKKIDEAAAIFRESIDTLRRSGGENCFDLHWGYATAARLDFSRRDYLRAEAGYRRAIDILTAVVGADHSLVSDYYARLGAVRFAQGDAAETRKLFRRSVSLKARQLVDLQGSQSEAQQLLAILNGRQLLGNWLTVTSADSSAVEAYEEVLAWKGAIFHAAADREQSARDPKALETAAKLTATRRKLSALGSMPPPADAAAKWQASLGELTDLKERLEIELAGLSAVYRERRRASLAGVQEVRRALDTRTAVVDFVKYPRLYRPDATHQNLTSAEHYVGFIVTHDQVRRIELGPADAVESAVRAWRGSAATFDDAAAADLLRRLVWEPVQAALPPNIDTVYICPDDTLTTIPWSALPGSRIGSVLLEQFAIGTLPSVRFMLERSAPTSTSITEASRCLVVADLDYDRAPHRSAVAAVESAKTRSASVDPNRQQPWDPLPNTRRELDALRVIAKDSSLIELVGTEATADRIFTELPKVRFAVFATHGYFAPISVKSVGRMIESPTIETGNKPAPRFLPAERNPLLRSGLVLSGANHASQVDGAGIFTAEAITGLDLSLLDLCVLSACESGLGETAAGEGVFGLQRAFHVAGCSNVVASLWKVDDEATAALMRLFYENLWKNKQSPLEALRSAQLTLLRNPTEIPNYATRGPGIARPLPNVEKSVARPTPGRTDIRRWAAFQLSGVGK